MYNEKRVKHFLRISSSSSRVHRHQYATALLFDSDDCYTQERERKRKRKRKEQEFLRSIQRKKKDEKENAFTSSIFSRLSNIIADRILYLNKNNRYIPCKRRTTILNSSMA